MQCDPPSMNEICKKNLEKDKKAMQREDDYKKSYREAKLMAAFLKNLISVDSKKENGGWDKRWVDPFSPPPSELEALTISKITYGNGGYHFYKQKYLAVYNPIKNFNRDQDKSIKNKIHNWFRIKNSKKQYRSKFENTTAKLNNNDKLSPFTSMDTTSSLKVFFCYLAAT
ncbi:hypothetical protein S83_026942 [Arachis hypogaea]